MSKRTGKTIVFYHQIDLDGIGSAAVVLFHFGALLFDYKESIVNGNKRYFNDLFDVRGVNYDKAPYLGEIDPADSIYLLDYSFDRQTMKRLSQNSLVWIDHHDTNIRQAAFANGQLEDWAKKSQTLFDMRSSPDLCGAIELTWLFLRPKDPVPVAVTLLGAFDTYRFRGRRKDLEYVLSYQYGARILDLKPVSKEWLALLGPGDRQSAIEDELWPSPCKHIPVHPGHAGWSQESLDILRNGKLLKQAKDHDNAIRAGSARVLKIENPWAAGKHFRALVCNTGGNSDVLRSRWNPQQHDLLCFFFAKRHGWAIRFFSGGGKSRVHLGNLATTLAKKHGFFRHDGSPAGGGREDAAGIDLPFLCDVQKILPID